VKKHHTKQPLGRLRKLESIIKMDLRLKDCRDMNLIELANNCIQ
jgi:hypothetical protein